jgi:glycosyltransferase involved in cell wall biosynthesis
MARGPGGYFRSLFASLREKTCRGLRRRIALHHRVVALARHIRKEGITHVHAQFAFTPAAVARLASAAAGSRFSVGTHAWDIHAQKRSRVAQFLSGAEFVTCCTAGGREALDGILPPEQRGDVLLVRHGLALPEEEPAAASATGSLVLAVGRLVRKKGLCNLVDACHILKHRGVPLNCLLVGDGPLQAALGRMIEHLDLGDTVRMLGALPHQSISPLMASETAVFVLPSVIAPDGDRDGLPNVILEAMAAGVPVVTTTASAAGEAITDGGEGFLVPPDEPEPLADRIEQLLGDIHLRQRMGKAGRERVRSDFRPEQCVKPLVERFNRLPDALL